MKTKLDKYENDILSSYENDEWVEVPEIKKEIKKHASYAKATIKKDKRVNIRISQKRFWIDSAQGFSWRYTISNLDI